MCKLTILGLHLWSCIRFKLENVFFSYGFIEACNECKSPSGFGEINRIRNIAAKNDPKNAYIKSPRIDDTWLKNTLFSNICLIEFQNNNV